MIMSRLLSGTGLYKIMHSGRSVYLALLPLSHCFVAASDERDHKRRYGTHGPSHADTKTEASHPK